MLSVLALPTGTAGTRLQRADIQPWTIGKATKVPFQKIIQSCKGWFVMSWALIDN